MELNRNMVGNGKLKKLNGIKITEIGNIKKCLMIILLLFGCNRGEVKIEDQPPYKQARMYLEMGEHYRAYQIFEKLIKEEGEKPEYLLGLVLSNAAIDFSKLPEKVKQGFSFFSPTLKLKQEPEGLNLILERFIKDIILDTIENNLPILEKVIEKIDENFVFDITGLTINFPQSPLVFLGKWGDVEVYYLFTLGHYVRALIRFILSINVNAPVLTYYNIASFVNQKGGWAYFFGDPLRVGLPAIANLLNSSTSILTLRSKENIQIAKNSMLLSAEYYGKTYLGFKREYERRNRREGFLGHLDEKFTRVHISVIAGGEKKTIGLAYVEESQKFFENSQRVIKHIKGEYLQPVECSILANTLESIIRFFISSGLISSAAESALKMGVGKNVKDFLIGMITLVDILYIIAGICKSDVVEIDLRNLLEKFDGIRKLIPVWTYTSSGFKDSIWFEWECGTNSLSPNFGILDENAGYFACKRREPLTDSEHFSDKITIGAGIREVAGIPVTQPSEDCGTIPFEECLNLYGGINPIDKVPKDDQLSRLPYLLWQDPSFYNSLWIVPQRIGKTFCGAPFERHIPRGVTGVCELNALLWYMTPK